MNEFIKKHAKAYMILSICFLISAVGGSYAYYAATVSNSEVVVGQAGGGSLPLLTISKVSTEANGNLIPIDMNTATLTKAASASPKCIDNNGYSSCQIYSVTVQNNSTIAQSYNVELTRVSGPTTPNVDAVAMGTSDSAVTNSSSIKDNGLICTTNSVGNGETTTPCYFMVLIKNLDEAQTDNGTFTGTVTITSTSGSKLKANFGTGEKLTTTISNLYNNATKTEVDAEDELTYNYATSVSLMNDRLGNASTGLNDGNIRYYGASPNNYVDIGDHYEQDTIVKNWIEPMKQVGFVDTKIPTDTASCKNMMQCSALVAGNLFTSETECETLLPYMLESFGFTTTDELCSVSTVPAGTPKSLYRIIGLFKNVELTNGTKKDLIKVVKATTLGNYSWDQSPEDINNGSGINEWSQADLMKLLNPGYEDETVGGSLYWNSVSGLCYGWDSSTKTNTSVPCDFTNNGISASAQNNIEAVKWNLGGWNTNTVYANEIYGYERGNTVHQIGSNSPGNDTIPRTTLWQGRVALPYPSDYGYAVDLNSCNSALDGYSNSLCTGTNWMFNSIAGSGYTNSWLLTPNSSSRILAMIVLNNGSIIYNTEVLSGMNVSPVFYLDSELTIESGTGKSDDPYVLW